MTPRRGTSSESTMKHEIRYILRLFLLQVLISLIILWRCGHG